MDEGCLIDIKCVIKPERTPHLRQAIAYALLDVDDEHQLDSVGIYLARQGIFWKVPLDDIAKQAGETFQELRDNAPWGRPVRQGRLEGGVEAGKSRVLNLPVDVDKTLTHKISHQCRGGTDRAALVRE